MELNFTVNNQWMIRTDKHMVVSDSKNYLTARFQFTDEWNGTKTAIFTHEETSYCVMLEDNCCLVPWEVIQPSSFSVSVFCGDLITANRSIVEVAQSGYTQGETPSDPTPDVYSQITQHLNEIKDISQSVRDDADAGKFKGEKGDPGERGIQGVKGDTGQEGYTPQRGTDYWTEVDQAEIISEIREETNQIVQPVLGNVDSLNNTVFGSVTEEYQDVTSNYNILDNTYINASGVIKSDAYSYAYNCILADCSPGEEYKITTNKGNNLPLVVYYNASGVMLSKETSAATASAYVDVAITMPENCYRMGITNVKSANYPNPIIKKKTMVSGSGLETDVDTLQTDVSSLWFEKNSSKESVIHLQEQNDFAWKPFDKAYVTFSFDDCCMDMDLVQSIFDEFELPCCYAAIPSKLNQVTTGTGDGETSKEVLERCVLNGGEVLAHNSLQITTSNMNDAVFLHNYFVVVKRQLTEAGFEINGIIKAGGEGTEPSDWNPFLKWLRPYYRYCDTLGKNTGVVQYDKMRTYISTSDSVNQNNINTAITNKSWLSLCSHSITLGRETLDTTETALRNLLTYIKSLGSQVEVLTFRELHDRFGTTKIEQNLNDRIGLIETALDGIITLQNSYIGGDGI